MSTGTSSARAATAESGRPTGESRRGSALIPVAALALVVAATLAAYSPVFFNFFNGDDFVHLTWLKEAVKTPELIWRNFHSSWLDGTTTKFYRPLISVFMVTDYLIYGTNGLGFRATNLACHLVSSLFLFLLVLEFGKAAGFGDRSGRNTFCAWALAASALFALYPLHPEAVSWITGRVDSVVTVFCLGSMWFYTRWRRSGAPGWLAAAVVFMILGLLSKEMAITLPAVFLLWELCFQRSAHLRRQPAAYVGAALKPTVVFWLLLAGYFLVRRLALGTFVGGYDDSLLFVANLKNLLYGWYHGLRMMVVPINKELLGAHHPLTKLWETAVLSSAVLSCWAVWKAPGLRRPALFTVVWFALSLAPVYKIFNIAPDLQASRLAYLATAPLAVLLALGFAGWPAAAAPARVGAYVRGSVAALLVGVAATLLWVNNGAWAEAGRQSAAIRAALDKLYRQVDGDPQILFIGLPDNVKGAYVCRNALWGMTKTPQMHRDVYNAVMIDRFEPVLPFGYLKASLREAGEAVKVYRWSEHEAAFRPVALPSPAAGAGTDRKLDLRQAAAAVHKPTTSVRARPDGSLEVRGGPGFRGRPEVLVNLNGVPCFDVDFLSVTVAPAAPGGLRSGSGADLLYSNDLTPDFELSRRTHATVPSGDGDRVLIFPLRSLPEWSLGGSCRGLKLMLPDSCHLLVKGVAVVAPEKIMPRIGFANSGYLGSKGFIHLSREKTREELSVDGASVAGAADVILEISRANLVFETQNSQDASAVVMRRLTTGSTTGKVTITRDMFPAAGMYEIRARAVDWRGNPVGVAGDHLVISVDS